MRFKVTLDRESSETVTVQYATEDVSATAGEDYEERSGTLTFEVGQTEAIVAVPIIDDSVEDNGETFILRLSNASNGLLFDSAAVGTISNTESPISTEPGGEDLPADTTTNGVVMVGGSATGRIEAPIGMPDGDDSVLVFDEDWFGVELEAGKSYRIDIEGASTGAGTLINPSIRGVYSSGGNLIGEASEPSRGWEIERTLNQDGGVGYNERVNFTATADGTYYIAVAGTNYHAGSYRVSVTEVVTEGVTDDFSADSTTTGEVQVGGSASGEIETLEDQDWFAVELVSGQTYRFDLQGEDTGHGTLQNPCLRGIYDSDGDLIADTYSYDDGVGYNCRVDFTATETGTHYVAASAQNWEDFRSDDGTYVLSVTNITNGAPGDISADLTTTGTVDVGGSVHSDIAGGASDQDWFAVTLEAGITYRFDLEGAATGGGNLQDPYLRGIYDAEGDLIEGTTDNNSGLWLNSRVFFTADGAGTYYVAAGSFQASGGYTLSVEEEM